MILLASRQRKPENILKAHPGAILADITSKSDNDLVKLSPFYPHGGIPVPFSLSSTAACVCKQCDKD